MPYRKSVRIFFYACCVEKVNRIHREVVEDAGNSRCVVSLASLGGGEETSLR
jgi:hypothetical protein